jgi:hypothetical protein
MPPSRVRDKGLKHAAKLIEESGGGEVWRPPGGTVVFPLCVLSLDEWRTCSYGYASIIQQLEEVLYIKQLENTT